MKHKPLKPGVVEKQLRRAEMTQEQKVARRRLLRKQTGCWTRAEKKG